jgi:dTDP-4-amino-4,6-dideoxygalactose transaminase
MPDEVVPFNVPYVPPGAAALLDEALHGRKLAGDGPFTRRAAEALSKLVGGATTLLTTSCTHALELASLLLELGPGDEVIMPSFTFVSTANAVVARGATPVFVDVRPDTLNLDERLVEQAVTTRTKAVYVVHYAGVACAMDELCQIADRHGLAIVEDNAHGLGGSYRGRPLGSIGRLATQSFHATKNVQCGEGGALVLNDARLVERAEILREKGTDRSKFLRGQVDKYTWVDVGSSYLPSDLLAALLLAGLESATDVQAARTRVWDAYDVGLADWARESSVTQPTVPEDCQHPAHLYYLLMPTAEHRSGLIDHLAARGVSAVFHYVPLHDSPAGRRLGRTSGTCEVTSDISSRLLRLPLFADQTAEQVERVVQAVRAYRT